MNGYVGIQNVAASYDPSTIIKIELLSNTGNAYTFKVTYRDNEMYNHYLCPENEETILKSDCYFQSTIICEYIIGHLVISKTLSNS